MPKIQEIKDFLSYSPESGEFTWIKSPCNKIKVGDTCGTIKKTKNSVRYLVVSIDKKQYLLHRLVFLFMEGRMPDLFVDHIDGNGLNNCFSNLRKVDIFGNARNCRKSSRNSSGVTGVYYQKDRNKWRAQIGGGRAGKTINLGNFSTKEDAIKYRISAQKTLGFHDNHGR